MTPTSRREIVTTIVRKDVLAFYRDRFFLVVTILGLVFMIGIFWLLPSTVDETITVGLTGIPGAEAIFPEGEGLAVIVYDSEEALTNAVERGEDGVAIGLSFPPDFLAAVVGGQETTVRVLATADVPAELRTTMDSIIREAAFGLAGQPLPVDYSEEILGVDRVGEQLSLRDKMKPLLAFMVLIIEMLSLASLVASEIQARTVTAVLTTPARISDFLTAKVIVGTGLAFIQAVILLIAIRSLWPNTLLLLVAMLLGALLATAFGLLAGSYGRDFITVMFWSILFLIPLMIPAFGALFPGTASFWIKAIPTYGLVEAIVGTTSYGEGWAEALPNLAMVVGWIVVVYLIALNILKRKVEAL